MHHEDSEKVQARNRTVLDAAVQCATLGNYRTMTRNDVAARAGVSTGTVNWAFGTMDGLRDAVMAHAVVHGPICLVAQGLADRHPTALGASQDLKDAALASLAA